MVVFPMVHYPAHKDLAVTIAHHSNDPIVVAANIKHGIRGNVVGTSPRVFGRDACASRGNHAIGTDNHRPSVRETCNSYYCETSLTFDKTC